MYLKNPPEQFKDWTTYEEVFMGAVKVLDTVPHIPKEREKNPPRQMLEYFNFENCTHIPEFKEMFYKAYNVKIIPQQKPLVIFVERAQKRRIVNQYEAYDALKQAFPEVNICMIQPELYQYSEQMELFRASELVIAAHGMALCQSLWMNESKSVIEIFPYHLECRDWYASLAKANKLHYQYFTPSFDPFENETKKNPELKKCLDQDACQYNCLDKTLFTNAWVDIPTLINLTRKGLIDAGVKLKSLE